MIIEHQDALRVWLAKELAPVCDAEPEALAKYVQALLKKDKPENELMEFCIEQLDVFLQTQARPFVTRLFDVIKERSYLPTQITSKPLSSNESSTEASSKSALGSSFDKKRDSDDRKEVKEKDVDDRKKSSQSEKEREQRKTRDEKENERKSAQDAGTSSTVAPPRTVRKRISPPPASRDDVRRDGNNRFERRRSRSPRERRMERGERVSDRRSQLPQTARGSHRQNERYKNERNDRTERKQRSRSPYERSRRDKSAEGGERRKKRCRDYDEKGYCMKGDQCIYDHGPDPLVVDDNSFEKMVSGGAKPSAVVPQITPNFSIPPPGYTPVNPPPPGVDSVYMANSTAVPTVIISEGYNPEAPALSASAAVMPPPVPISVDFSVPPPTIQYSTPSWAPPVYPTSSANVLVQPSTPYDPIQSSTTAPIQNTTVVHQQTQVPRGGGPVRRGRGNLGGYGNSGTAVPTGSNNRTLQVRKIPNELNNITKLNEHFAQFGQIVNIQVCYDGDLEAALITYATRLEAMAAYKSTIPILNNRFIKVFWHNPGTQTSQNTKPSQQANGSTVKYNSKGSLTKTVMVGSQKPATPVQQVDGVIAEKEVPTVTQHRPQVLTENEKFSEVRRKRRLAKENKMRLLDLNRRKTDLLEKQFEQQKIVIEKIQKTKNSETRKELLKILKTLDESVATLKKELADLARKLIALSHEDEEAKINANGSGIVEANGVKRGIIDGHELGSNVKRARHSDASQALDKRTRVVVVRSFPPEYEDEVTKFMETFGDLEDVDVPDRNRGKALTAYFTYKKRRDAEQAVELASNFDACHLTVEWAPKGGYEGDGVIPDEKRHPAERVTPAALLASCPLEESDEDGNDD